MPKADYGAGATGALTGAASGAVIGSAVPVVGTAIGAVVGSLVGGLTGLFGGKKKKKAKKIDTMSPEQKRLFQMQYQGLMGEGPLSNLYNFDEKGARKNFEQMYSQPAYQNFQEGVVPGITGAFRGGNLQNSSYLGGALSKAGTDVQRNLDAQLANMLYQGQQASLDRRTQGINSLLGMQTFAYQKPEQQQPGYGEQFLGGFSNAAGKYTADYLNKNSGSTTATPPAVAPVPTPAGG